MRRIEKMTKACDPSTLTVTDLMQDTVVTCNPRMDALGAARLMTERNFGSLPVTDEDGALLGLVSEYDLLQATIEGRDLRKIMVEEIMSRPVLTVPPDMTLVQLANLFQDRYVTRVPVVKGQRLVGIVARRDLLYGYLKALSLWS